MTSPSLADMEDRPRSQTGREWLEANDGFRRDVLSLLADSGPMLSRDIPETSAVPWKSTVHDDRLVGKLDAKANRKGSAGGLRHPP